MSKRKCWSDHVGCYGCTIRIVERRPGGSLYFVWLDRQGKQQKRSLGHADRQKAKTEAVEYAAEIAKSRDVFAGGRLTFTALFDIYVAKGLAGKSPRYAREAIRKLARWRTFLGDRLIVSLSPSDVTGFIEWRRQRSSVELRDTTLWHDWVSLNRMLHFATEEKDARGRYLLPKHPLPGVTVSRTVAPMRPVATQEYVSAVGQVAAQLPWQFGVALDLARATGHRIGAILQLRWSDIDLTPTKSTPHGQITWRATSDKLSLEHQVPMNALAKSAIERAREIRAGVGEAFVIPSPSDSALPLDRHLASRWLRKAEKYAGLPHVRGQGWHAMRRAWASARMHLPDRDVATAGGWKDTKIMKEAYQHSSRDSILAAVLATA
jgi:integrase